MLDHSSIKCIFLLPRNGKYHQHTSLWSPSSANNSSCTCTQGSAHRCDMNYEPRAVMVNLLGLACQHFRKCLSWLCWCVTWSHTSLDNRGLFGVSSPDPLEVAKEGPAFIGPLEPQKNCVRMLRNFQTRLYENKAFSQNFQRIQSGGLACQQKFHGRSPGCDTHIIGLPWLT